MKRNTKIKNLKSLEAVERDTLYRQVVSKINLERFIRKKEKEREESREKRLKEAGITLIALVITIVLNCLRSGRKLECTA